MRTAKYSHYDPSLNSYNRFVNNDHVNDITHDKTGRSKLGLHTELSDNLDYWMAIFEQLSSDFQNKMFSTSTEPFNTDSEINLFNQKNSVVQENSLIHVKKSNDSYGQNGITKKISNIKCKGAIQQLHGNTESSVENCKDMTLTVLPVAEISFKRKKGRPRKNQNKIANFDDLYGPKSNISTEKLKELLTYGNENQNTTVFGPASHLLSETNNCESFSTYRKTRASLKKAGKDKNISSGMQNGEHICKPGITSENNDISLGDAEKLRDSFGHSEVESNPVNIATNIKSSICDVNFKATNEKNVKNNNSAKLKVKRKVPKNIVRDSYKKSNKKNKRKYAVKNNHNLTVCTKFKEGNERYLSNSKNNVAPNLLKNYMQSGNKYQDNKETNSALCVSTNQSILNKCHTFNKVNTKGKSHVESTVIPCTWDVSQMGSNQGLFSSESSIVARNVAIIDQYSKDNANKNLEINSNEWNQSALLEFSKSQCVDYESYCEAFQKLYQQQNKIKDTDKVHDKMPTIINSDCTMLSNENIIDNSKFLVNNHLKESYKVSNNEFSNCMSGSFNYEDGIDCISKQNTENECLPKSKKRKSELLTNGSCDYISCHSNAKKVKIVKQEPDCTDADSLDLHTRNVVSDALLSTTCNKKLTPDAEPNSFVMCETTVLSSTQDSLGSVSAFNSSDVCTGSSHENDHTIATFSVKPLVAQPNCPSAISVTSHTFDTIQHQKADGTVANDDRNILLKKSADLVCIDCSENISISAGESANCTDKNAEGGSYLRVETILPPRDVKKDIDNNVTSRVDTVNCMSCLLPGLSFAKCHGEKEQFLETAFVHELCKQDHKTFSIDHTASLDSTFTSKETSRSGFNIASNDAFQSSLHVSKDELVEIDQSDTVTNEKLGMDTDITLLGSMGDHFSVATTNSILGNLELTSVEDQSQKEKENLIFKLALLRFINSLATESSDTAVHDVTLNTLKQPENVSCSYFCNELLDQNTENVTDALTKEATIKDTFLEAVVEEEHGSSPIISFNKCKSNNCINTKESSILNQYMLKAPSAENVITNISIDAPCNNNNDTNYAYLHKDTCESSNVFYAPDTACSMNSPQELVVSDCVSDAKEDNSCSTCTDELFEKDESNDLEKQLEELELTKEEQKKVEDIEWGMWMEKLHNTDIQIFPTNVEQEELKKEDTDSNDIDVILLNVRETVTRKKENEIIPKYKQDLPEKYEESNADILSTNCEKINECADVEILDALSKRGFLVSQVQSEASEVAQQNLQEEANEVSITVIGNSSECNQSRCEQMAEKDEIIISTLGWSELDATQEVTSTRMLHWSYCRMTNHLLDPTRESFKCPLCEYKSPRKGHVERHILIHSGEKPYSCNECNYKSHTKDAMTLHSRVHSGQKKFECDQCSYSTNRKVYLERHVALHDEGEKGFPCSVCVYRASKHRLEQGKEAIKAYKKFGDDIDTSDARDSQGPVFAVDSDSDGDWYCAKSSMQKDIAIYNEDGNELSDNNEEYDEILTVSDLPPCRCHINASKSLDKNIVRRVKIYSEDRPFPCPQCSYRATKKSLLDKHIKVHTGERPFPCPLCKYRASRKAHLLRHMRTHQKELE